jgi:hypothetical protein
MKLIILACLSMGLIADSARAQFNSVSSLDSSLDQGKVIAHYLQIVSSEMVTDVYQNGKIVPAKQHVLQAEIFGAQIERVNIEIHEGDWIVFHAVNNDLRGGFPRYFVAAAMADSQHSVFQSETESGQWFRCDTLERVPAFISNRNDHGDGKPRLVTVHWGDGDKQIAEKVPDWSGEPIWGVSHEPWLKYIVPPRPLGEN